MANQLKMAITQSILQLHSLHWSQRQIAARLGIDPGTVRRCLRRHVVGANAAISPAGCEGSKTLTHPPAPGTRSAEADLADSAALGGDSNAAISPTGSPATDESLSSAISPNGSPVVEHSAAARAGRHSHCDPYEELIRAKLEAELSAQRIFQDLCHDHGFTGSYDSVKRFVRRLGNARPLPFRRMECGPADEAQVDFGSGAPIVGDDGKRRRTHVFRIVLSHSRKAYSEATYWQTTEDFLGALENAFWNFGGVPKTLVIDNLKAAVKHPDWFDPELVPKLQSFAAHYGVAILPAKPYMARHKGKVESSVKYVKNNALKARTFRSLEEQNRFLADWERAVADTRIHGTTRRQVGKVFAEVERPALLPLPAQRFASFHEAQRKVSRDGHVEVAKAYYSVPPEHLGRTVWARWDARVVRIFDLRFQQIAIHVRHEQGRFSTNAAHLAPEKISGLEKGAAYLLGKIEHIGPHSHQWAQAMVHARGIEGTRVLLGLLGLTKKHAWLVLEKACETALLHGAFHLRTIRQLLGRQAAKQEPLPFLDEHPIIRPLDDYAAVVARAIHRQADRSSMSEGFPRHGRTKECPFHTGQQKRPGDPPKANRQGSADILPPGSGYPSPGCTSAEPDSVSPDSSSLARVSSTCQEHDHA